MNNGISGSILLQRLDAILGLSLASYGATDSARARFSVPAQPPSPVRRDSATPEQGNPDGALRSGRGARPQGAQAQSVPSARTAAVPDDAADTAQAAVLRHLSAQITWGPAMRLILAIMESRSRTADLALPGRPLVFAEQLAASAARAQTPAAQAAPAAAANAAARAAAGSAPAAPGAAGNPIQNPALAQLVRALELGVRRTGMFYESLLGRVTFGAEKPTVLADQPQVLLARAFHVAQMAPQVGAQVLQADWGRTMTAAEAGRLLQPLESPAAGAAPPTADAASAQSHAAAGPTTSPLSTTLTQGHALLVRQQLDVLASQTLHIDGEAWPGVPLQWEIRRERRGDDSSSDEDGGAPEPKPRAATEAAWHTRLTLDLPHLGALQVDLHCVGQRWSMTLGSAAAAPLRAGLPEFAARLRGLGIDLSDLAVADLGEAHGQRL